MKFRALALTSVASVALLSTVALADEPAEHKVVTRLDHRPPASALPFITAAPKQGAFTQNVVMTSERALNPETDMLKKGSVQPVGVDGASAWGLMSDEGGETYEQSAPNPLSYFTTGMASNLYTQVQRAAEAMGLDIDDITVEAKAFYRYDAPMTDAWAGYTDKVIANILIESDEAPEKLEDLKEIALRGWIVGEALANETDVLSELAVNGTHWDETRSMPGAVPDPVSIDHGQRLSQKTPAPQPESLDLGPDLDMAVFAQNPEEVEFAVVAIAQSAEDPERPSLQRINVRAMQDGYVGWDLYADDELPDGLDKAPTSLDYFVAGTSFCLMTQLTAADFLLDLDVADYRVEHEYMYRQEGYATTAMEGFTDRILTRLVVDSSEEREALQDYFDFALRLCFAGEAVLNETPISTDLYVNGARLAAGL